MSSISPPTERIWWKQPIDRMELTWIGLCVVWGLTMTFMMPYWHVVGKQNISNEAYRIKAEKFQEKTQAMVDKYTVRTETDRDIPVVAPPVGSDVYLISRRWDWWPLLEFKVGQSYRLHLSSLDWQHGFSLQPANINLQILPGYDMVVTITPNKTGEQSIICNEYCGIGHHRMIGKIYVTE